MKVRILLVLFLGLSNGIFSQEICDNAIDDDGDGLIDLNDDECDCEGYLLESADHLNNPSFEEMDCCPYTHAQLECASGWVDPSSGSDEYFNLCDYIEFSSATMPDITDLPGDGSGWIGYAYNASWYREYAGSCLEETLYAGTEYTLNFYTAWGKGEEVQKFAIFGTPTCDDIPWGTNTCPIGHGSWELIGSTSILCSTEGFWKEVTITFTPTININAVAIGGSCEDIDQNSYYYLDEFTLAKSGSTEIIETGNICDDNLTLESSIDTTGWTIQWYKDGIALSGETSEILNVNDYGMGDYSIVYFLDGNCQRTDYTVSDPEYISANFEFSSACSGNTIEFINTSILGDMVTAEWEWDFGGDGTSTAENPNHVFSTPGTYTVQLVAINDLGCNDTIEIEVTIDPVPVSNFEFVIAGNSSLDGSTGGCIENTVQFNDLSTIALSGEIISWDWDFGGDGTSTEENPEHIFSSPGTYTIELTVETDNGCSSTFEQDIIMTTSLELDITFGQPSCFGFTDGSVTVNVTGTTGDITFVIMDENSTVINEENSNAANTLGTGWYYFNVSDESLCTGIDSIFIPEPAQLSADITTFDVRCYGDASGWARVDTVRNWQGDYDQMAYFWAPNTSGIEGIGADSTFNMTAGTYTLTLNDDNGCSRVYNFEITQPDSLYFVEFGMDPAFCRVFDYQNGNGQVFGAASGGVADYDYLWTDLETGNTSINSTWGGRNPGDYELTATDQNGCTITQTITVDSLNPQAIFTVTSDQLNEDCKGTAPVEAFFYNNSINYANENDPLADTIGFWNLDTLTNSTWILTEDFDEVFDTMYLSRGQTYDAEVCLTVQNKNGCSDTECKTVTIFEDIVFDQVNVFSPNGDGVNDEFTFEYRSASIAELNCVIVNRWGVVVHEMNDINDAWDGTDRNGDPCASGVYFYTYEALTDNSVKLVGQGNIQLVRVEL